MKKKSNIIALIVVLVLVVIMGVALVLNKAGLDANKEAFENIQLNVFENGEKVGTISYEEIVALGAVEFEAIHDTSKTEPVVENYKGVELKKIFEHFDISLEDKSAVTGTAVDNFAMAYTAEEVLEDDNLYVTFERNGESIQGEEEDGSGPLLIIVKNDLFSNRRCKWLVSVGAE